MQKLLFTGIAIAVIGSVSPAFAYRAVLESDNAKACVANAGTCQVYCNNGHLAGSMNWNGGVWTDGVKSDATMDGEAKKITAADGTACI